MKVSRSAWDKKDAEHYRSTRELMRSRRYGKQMAENSFLCMTTFNFDSFLHLYVVWFFSLQLYGRLLVFLVVAPPLVRGREMTVEKAYKKLRRSNITSEEEINHQCHHHYQKARCEMKDGVELRFIIAKGAQCRSQRMKIKKKDQISSDVEVLKRWRRHADLE